MCFGIKKCAWKKNMIRISTCIIIFHALCIAFLLVQKKKNKPTCVFVIITLVTNMLLAFRLYDSNHFV